MNLNLTEIAFVLDRSGSMHSMKTDAIGGFNAFVKDQLDASCDANLTLVLFDHDYVVPFESMAIRDVPPLDDKTYVPRGNTALLDAMGLTIDALGARLAGKPEVERPGKVVVAILTDGEENASHNFTHADIEAKIRHQTDLYQWSFLFLAANQDAIATASRFGIAAHDAATFQSDGVGSQAGSSAISKKIKAMRRMAASVDNEEDRTVIKESMQNLQDREDRSRR